MRYLGGKSRLARRLAEHLTSHGATRYVEPFVGGGAVLTAVAASFDEILAADAHPDLVLLYQGLQDGTFTPPETVTEDEYLALAEAEPSALRGFVGFGCSFGGAWFRGWARTEGRNYAAETARNLGRSAKAGAFGPHVTYLQSSVFDLELPADLAGTVIYCDPPYAGTQAYKGLDPFDSDRAWALYEAWAARGAHVYVSEYDGPERYLAAEWDKVVEFNGNNQGPTRGRVTERLYYIPPKEQPMTDTAPERPPLEVTATRYVRPRTADLPRIQVPDARAYYPHLGAWLSTGEPARAAVTDLPAGATVAVDTETMGLGAEAFTLKCVTAAWETTEGTVAVLLDPLRRAEDAHAVGEIMSRAGALVFHNAPFDVPPLFQHALMTLDDIGKVHDTAVYARMAYPDRSVKKNLESLATTHVGIPESEVTMAALFKASGLTLDDGFRVFDIDRPVYRLGAMADTVATLRLLTAVQAAAWSRLVEGHPFGEFGVDSAGAVALMEREQRVNRIMLRRSAVGLAVDTDYLTTYEEEHSRRLTEARDALAAEGLDPDAGNLNALLVARIDESGELPADWPRTDTGRLRATKEDLPKLDHPLASAVRTVLELAKVTGYLTKVTDMVQVTGRVHPQVSVLGASATGRMSYSWPELQQFPADARPIIVSPGGLTSVDWSQIEPVVMANCAKDWPFLAGFEAGEDLYAPIQAEAGVERKIAKVLLLAAMYGQGRGSMARDLGVDVDTAARYQAGMFAAMPTTRQFIDRLRQIGESTGLMISADGRVLPVPKDPWTGQVQAYKAVNYFCQGSAYSVLADTLARLDEAGLADSVHLALHDELVVDTEAAEAVAEVMRTPPEFLLKWTEGRVPVFKTDTNDMGTAWAYV